MSHYMTQILIIIVDLVYINMYKYQYILVDLVHMATTLLVGGVLVSSILCIGIFHLLEVTFKIVSN